MDCEQVRFDLAVEALTGGREPVNATGDAHLARCASCRLEREELRGLVGMLADIVPRDRGSAPVPDPEGAVSAVRERTPVPPGGGTGGAGKVPASPWPLSHTALALGTAFVSGLLVGDRLATTETRNDAAEPPPEAVRTVSVTGAEAAAEVHARPWGSEITLSLAELSGPRRCRLVAVSWSGRREAVGNWYVPGGRYAVPGHRDRLTLTGSSSLAVDEIAALEVETAVDCDR
ncbi:hypothetical protein AB0M97_25360 [Streptomyces sp. NPDC051207]|uniref:hypothetical protein n=1 Tax=Streptomyces sp. NPDC051207 TaxID=3154641 RepID=UPI00343F5C61